jgi:hypothetical protein
MVWLYSRVAGPVVSILYSQGVAFIALRYPHPFRGEWFYRNVFLSLPFIR